MLIILVGTDPAVYKSVSVCTFILRSFRFYYVEAQKIHMATAPQRQSFSPFSFGKSFIISKAQTLKFSQRKR